MSMIPDEVINGIKDGFDLNFYLFGNNISNNVMWIVMILTLIGLFGVVILVSNRQKWFKNNHLKI